MTKDRLLRLEEVAQRTGLTVRALRQLRWAQSAGRETHLPRLAFRHLGRRLSVLEADLDAWLLEAAVPVESQEVA